MKIVRYFVNFVKSRLVISRFDFNVIVATIKEYEKGN